MSARLQSTPATMEPVQIYTEITDVRVTKVSETKTRRLAYKAIRPQRTSL